MLRLWQNNSDPVDIKVSENSIENYTDVTSINLWLGMVAKYNYNENEAADQIKLWVEYHKTNNLETNEHVIIDYFYQLINEAPDGNFVLPR